MKKKNNEKEISGEQAIAEKVKKLQKEERDEKKDRVKYMPESRTVIVIVTAVICFLIVLGGIFMIAKQRKDEKYADQYILDSVLSNDTSKPAVTVSAPINTTDPVENIVGDTREITPGTDYHPVESPTTQSTTGVTMHNVTPNIPKNNYENGGNAVIGGGVGNSNGENSVNGGTVSGASNVGNSGSGTVGTGASNSGNNVNGIGGIGASDGGKGVNGVSGSGVLDNGNGPNGGNETNPFEGNSSNGGSGLGSSNGANAVQSGNGASNNSGNGINGGNNAGGSDNGNSNKPSTTTKSMNTPEIPTDNSEFTAPADTGVNDSDWDLGSFGIGTPSTVGGNNGVNTVPFDENIEVEDWFLI